jgi:hypothetical protein
VHADGIGSQDFGAFLLFKIFLTHHAELSFYATNEKKGRRTFGSNILGIENEFPSVDMKALYVIVSALRKMK